MTIDCVYDETLLNCSPFCSTPISAAPTTVPPTLPMPPKSDVPPMTTAEITVSS